MTLWAWYHKGLHSQERYPKPPVTLPALGQKSRASRSHANFRGSAGCLPGLANTHAHPHTHTHTLFRNSYTAGPEDWSGNLWWLLRAGSVGRLAPAAASLLPSPICTSERFQPPQLSPQRFGCSRPKAERRSPAAPETVARRARGPLSPPGGAALAMRYRGPAHKAAGPAAPGRLSPKS